MSLGYSVFVFTDEGDCMVTEMFGSSWSASVFKNYKYIYVMYSAMSSVHINNERAPHIMQACNECSKINTAN